MKRCPTCQSTYTDDSLGFCLTDGAALVDVAPFNPQATLPNEFQATLRNENTSTLGDDNQATLRYPATPTPPPRAAAEPQGIAHHAGPTPTPGWNPQAWSPHAHQPVPLLRRRNSTPWVVGGLVVLLLGAIVVVWAIIASRGSSNEARTLVNSNSSNETGGTPDKTPANRSTNRNSNQSTADVDAAPTDPDLVLSQLTALEYEWNDANIKGNKAAVRRILADEFRGVGADGSVKSKKELLATLEPEPLIASLKLSDLKISLAGDTVVLTGLNTAKSTGGQVLRFRFTDTFLWRDGRWQAISSQASQVK
ncbi:MAG TPA: nuclear transport factor 2 family protein [Pyrinomonadaceae bacterium]|nr:nuclear transport factor 2 family protein [Pyrinomonadaceae bacterium]